jgi:hypothetical protein
MRGIDGIDKLNRLNWVAKDNPIGIFTGDNPGGGVATLDKEENNEPMSVVEENSAGLGEIDGLGFNVTKETLEQETKGSDVIAETETSGDAKAEFIKSMQEFRELFQQPEFAAKFKSSEEALEFKNKLVEIGKNAKENDNYAAALESAQSLIAELDAPKETPAIEMAETTGDPKIQFAQATQEFLSLFNNEETKAKYSTSEELLAIRGKFTDIKNIAGGDYQKGLEAVRDLIAEVRAPKEVETPAFSESIKQENSEKFTERETTMIRNKLSELKEAFNNVDDSLSSDDRLNIKAGLQKTVSDYKAGELSYTEIMDQLEDAADKLTGKKSLKVEEKNETPERVQETNEVPAEYRRVVSAFEAWADETENAASEAEEQDMSTPEMQNLLAIVFDGKAHLARGEYDEVKLIMDQVNNTISKKTEKFDSEAKGQKINVEFNKNIDFSSRAEKLLGQYESIEKKELAEIDQEIEKVEEGLETLRARRNEIASNHASKKETLKTTVANAKKAMDDVEKALADAGL